MAQTEETAIPARRKAGRPRRLTLDTIVDTACDIGIERLEMAQVAERLETGVATLYGYVSSRDHLLGLVAQKMASRSLDHGQCHDWRSVLRDHAARCHSLFESDPYLIGNLMSGQNGDREIAYGVAVIDRLVMGGLDRKTAIDVYIETNQAVIGAAVMLSRRHTLANHAIDDEGNPVPLPKVLGSYTPTLDRIIRDCERSS